MATMATVRRLGKKGFGEEAAATGFDGNLIVTFQGPSFFGNTNTTTLHIW
jgi:hypothetical protein